MLGFLKSKKAALPVLGAGLFGTLPAAADPVTGLDVELLISTAITGVGVLVGAALAGYFAFKIIKVGLRWFGRVGG